ncbi:MAG: hypothetical protein RMI34_05365 [Chloroherpetonaceae bacterium]|nr:hypothetical protein [Chloroherpetonaceae bacterium]MDW8465878.1 hypothetical protein [Chloroherpetonaceae bacterium]
MKKVIVTTTINPVTEAIRKFQKMLDWELVVVGDLKTPKDYAAQLERGIYVTPEMQENRDKELSDAIGWNCIQRRNFGLLWAHDLKADIVAIVDDDNIPYDFWGKDLMVGKEVEVDYYETDLPAFDPVGATNYPHLWHRGYPLQLLPKRDYSKKVRKKIRVDVQADFWNGDPDIDAICRMEHAPDCTFEEKYFPMSSNKLMPFNSQNTFISGKWLKDYFLFPHIGRMDDIWAAYYVQAKGCSVAFSKASVFQARNPHDLVRDMKAEYLGYENNLKIVEELPNDPEKILNYLPGRAIYAFKQYQKHFK